MAPAALQALLEGNGTKASEPLGAQAPDDLLSGEEGFVRLRLEQMQRDPSLQEWLVRAVVLRETREVVGHAGFHGRAGKNGKCDPSAVEIGYTIRPAHRGQGLATEAAGALMRWARDERQVPRFILSIAPENDPSLAIARKLGFVQTGEVWDDEDGIELVFELDA
jgi:[ribosomal protein S5]-alanine N-acetyltransferase